MIKLDGCCCWFFFRMILKDNDLTMSFRNIMLDAARLAQYFVKLIMSLYHTHTIQFYINILLLTKSSKLTIKSTSYPYLKFDEFRKKKLK